MRFRAYPDCGISSSTFYSRVPNFRTVEFLRRHLNGGTFVDVGANVGLFTISLADKISHALLFEPNPLAATRARENLQLNVLPFEVLELALSDCEGRVSFENNGGVSTVNRTVAGFNTSVPTIEVQRTAFDQFLSGRRLPAPITVVKIDVEGHENSVLRGMSRCLQSDRPLVMFEYLERTNLKETFEIFTSVKYRVFFLPEIDKAEWATQSIAPLQDLFACPEEVAEYLIR